MKDDKRSILKNKAYRIRSILESIGFGREVFEEEFGREKAKEFISELEDILKNLNNQIEETPYGHVYEGKYYVKNYGAWEFEEKEGVLFMRHDLVTWAEGKGGYYIRHVFKDPKNRTPILREDGRPVSKWENFRPLEERMKDSFM